MALMLAAGASRRTGPRHKLLARDRNGQAMIVRSIRTALRSQAEQVIVVLGPASWRAIEDVLREAGLLGQARLRLVHAARAAEGLSASLHAGVSAAIDDGASGILVCLGDMPWVRASTLDRLLDELRSDPPPLACVPTLHGERGNPVGWSRGGFATLLELTGDRGARTLLDGLGASLRGVAVDDAGVLQDFDTPDSLADYAVASTPEETLP